MTRGEHKTTPRAKMQSREMACALALRAGKGGEEVLLEQRAEANTVMPGLWQLPMLRAGAKPGIEPRMTVRHAIMQVNYTVRVYETGAADVEALTAVDGQRRWVVAAEAGGMALTGLARKVLSRAHLLRRTTAAAR